MATITNELERILTSERFAEVNKRFSEIENWVPYSFCGPEEIITELSQTYNIKVLNNFLDNCKNIKDCFQLAEYLAVVNILTLKKELGAITDQEAYKILIENPALIIKQYFSEIKESAIKRTIRQREFLEARENLYS